MFRRWAPLLAGLAGAGIVLPFLVGIGPGLTTMVLLPLFAGLGVVALAAMRGATAAEPRWAGPLAPLDIDPSLRPVAPIPRTPAPPWRVAAALSRAEARDLSTSPWVGVGLGLLFTILLSFVGLWGPESGEHWDEVVALAPWLAHPFVGMVVLAAHTAATRARRDGCDELLDTCPAAPTTRTWALFGAAWVPVLVLAGFYAIYAAGSVVRSPDMHGRPGPGSVAVVLGGLALAVGGTALGVALGRWVRFALAPVAAVVAIGYASLRLAVVGDPGWNPLQQLSTLPSVSGDEGMFADGPEWTHLAWILALTGAVGVIALARHRRDRKVAVAALVASLLLVATGLAAVRPMSEASARRIAARVAQPEGQQTCRPSGPIQVCVFRGREELGAKAAAEVAPVAAVLPPGSTIVVRQRFAGGIDDLPPEVRRLLPDGVPPAPAGEVRLGSSASRGEIVHVRSLVAHAATGLPVDLQPEQARLDITGQARGVLALWMSTRGLGPPAASKLTSSRREDEHDCRDWAVAWSPQDLRAARMLGAAPEPSVRAAVEREWERWLDPATGTDELLAAVGLAPVGPFEPAPDGRLNPC